MKKTFLLVLAIALSSPYSVNSADEISDFLRVMEKRPIARLAQEYINCIKLESENEAHHAILFNSRGDARKNGAEWNFHHEFEEVGKEIARICNISKLKTIERATEIHSKVVAGRIVDKMLIGSTLDSKELFGVNPMRMIAGLLDTASDFILWNNLGKRFEPSD